MSTFVVGGVLGPLPAGVWIQGGTKFAYLEIGDTRFDNCWVVDYLVASLERSAGDEIELSFYKLQKNSVHLGAIKKQNGKVERMPEHPRHIVWDMMLTAVPFGFVTFVSTWFLAPLLLGIPFYLLRSILVGLGEKVIAPAMFIGFAAIWAVQLIWVLFFSKKHSPKIRLRVINTARAAFD